MQQQSIAQSNTPVITPSIAGNTKSNQVIHTGITCDSCKMAPIVGIRYKCANCDDFDVCSACEAKNVHNNDHVFIKLTQPVVRPWRSSLLPNVYVAPSQVRTPNLPAKKVSQQGFGQFVQYLARFVTDVTIPDGTEITANQKFTKIWRMRNEGTTDWPLFTKLLPTGGDRLGGPDEISVPSISPGNEIDIAVDMIAPSAPGKYVGYWRLSCSGNRFGHRIWVEIIVTPEKSQAAKVLPAPVPVATISEVKPEPESKPSEKRVEPQEVSVVPPVTETKPITVLPIPEPPYIYAAQIDQLAGMGFVNVELNKSILNKNRGSLVTTIQELVDRRW